jgi:hypothetical protein
VDVANLLRQLRIQEELDYAGWSEWRVEETSDPLVLSVAHTASGRRLTIDDGQGVARLDDRGRTVAAWPHEAVEVLAVTRVAMQRNRRGSLP